jgi:predicted nucleotidyltransferase
MVVKNEEPQDNGTNYQNNPEIPETPTNEEVGKETTPQGVKTDSKAIPYDRFKEVIDERNRIKAELEQIKKQQEEAQKKKLEEEKKWQQLYEQTKAELEQKEKQVEEQRLFNQTLVKAKELNVIDPEAAWALIKDKIDEQHTVEDLLKELIKKKPWLKKTSGAGYTLPGTGTSPTTLDADAISKMSMEQYRAFREKHKK